VINFTGDFGNEPDTTSISDRGLFRLLAGNLSPGVFRLCNKIGTNCNCRLVAVTTVLARAERYQKATLSLAAHFVLLPLLLLQIKTQTDFV
jgi:hypothetical protein